MLSTSGHDEPAANSTSKRSNARSQPGKVDELATQMANENKKQVIMQYSRYLNEVMMKLFGLKLLQRQLSLAGFENVVDLQQTHPYLLGRLMFYLVASSIVPANPLVANDKFNALNMVALATDTLEALQDLKETFARTREEIYLINPKHHSFNEQVWRDLFVSACYRTVSMHSLIGSTIHAITRDTTIYSGMSLDMLCVKLTSMVEDVLRLGGANGIQQKQLVTNPVVFATNVQSNLGQVIPCVFCTKIPEYANPATKPITHCFDQCKRKICKICKEKFILAPDKAISATFHLPSECPEREEMCQFLERTNRKRINDGKRSRSSSPYQHKPRSSSRSSSPYPTAAPRTMHLQNSSYFCNDDNESDAYYKLLLDTGANVSSVPSISTGVDIIHNTNNIRIDGLGGHVASANQQINIHGMKHYLIDMKYGIVAINELCCLFGVEVVFGATAAKIVLNNKVMATLPVQSGLYTMNSEDYIQLLQVLDSATVKSLRDESNVQHVIHLLKRFTLTRVDIEFLQLLHQCMGHIPPSGMVDAILAGLIVDIPQKLKYFHNTTLLCRSIGKYFKANPCVICITSNYKHRIETPEYAIKLYPSKPFMELSIDYKSSSHMSKDLKKGAFICSCMCVGFIMVYAVPAESALQFTKALEYFTQYGKSYKWQTNIIRFDATPKIPTDEVAQYAADRGMRLLPISVGDQHRNPVERDIQSIFRQFSRIQTSQFLLSIGYWPYGLITTANAYNKRPNIKTGDTSPYTAVTKSQPRLQMFKYGDPVIIAKGQHTEETAMGTHNISNGTKAIVVCIDDSQQYGVRIISCDSGSISHGYYSTMTRVPVTDMNYPHIKAHFIIKNDLKTPTPLMDNADLQLHLIPQYQPAEGEVTVTLPSTEFSKYFISQPTPAKPILHEPILHEIGISNSAIQIPIYTLWQAQQDTPTLPMTFAEYVQCINPDVDQVEFLNITEQQYQALPEKERNPSYKTAMKTPHRQAWVVAIAMELRKWIRYDTAEVVERSSVAKYNQPILHVKIVLTHKHILDQEKGWYWQKRARIAGRGDEEITHDDEDIDHAYSPTASLTTIKLLLATAVQHDYHIYGFDVISAFLKTPIQPTDENYYVQLPSELVDDTKVLRLRKTLYGLRLANKKFNELLAQVLLKYKLTQSVHDICLYYKATQKESQQEKISPLYLAMFVDDGKIIAQDENEVVELLAYLHTALGIEWSKEPKQFLKLQLDRQKDAILIHLSNYIDLMHVEEYHYTTLLDVFPHLKYDPLIPLPPDYSKLRKEYDQHERRTHVLVKDYQRILGKLVYIIYRCRDELAYAGHALASRQLAPDELDMFLLYHCYLHIKHTYTEALIFRKAKSFRLNIICDGSHMKHQPPGGITLGHHGFIITLGHCNIFTVSHPATRPCSSSTEDEANAATKASNIYKMIRNTLLELDIKFDNPSTHYTDSNSMIKLIMRQIQVSNRAKHFANDLSIMKYMVQQYNMQYFLTPTKQLPADLLTKCNIPKVLQLEYMRQIRDVQLFYMAMEQLGTTNPKLLFGKHTKVVLFLEKFDDMTLNLDNDELYDNELGSET